MVESDEAFTVTLSNPSVGAVIGTASANGTIRNDDASLSIAATSADKAEGQAGTTPFTFTVTWIGPHCMPTDGPWTVRVTTGFFFFGLTFASADATGEASATTVTTTCEGSA